MYAKMPPVPWSHVFVTMLVVAGMWAAYYFFGPIGWLIYIWLFTKLTPG